MTMTIPALAPAVRPITAEPLTFCGRALAAFCLTTFGLVGLVGLALFAFGIGPDHPIYLPLYGLGLVSPFLGALAYAQTRTGSLRPILPLYWPLRLGRGAWMIAAVPLSVAASYAVGTALGLPLDRGALPSLGAFALAAFGWSAVMWAEETGWRGVLLPILQDRLGPLVATLLVALAWTLWHLPLLVLLDMPLAGYGWFAAQSVGLSLAMTWAWNRSGTALVPMLIHGVNNATMMALVGAVPSRTAHELMAVQAAGPVVVGLVVLLATRGRLGLDAGRNSRTAVLKGRT